jgi:hypothetical protein
MFASNGVSISSAILKCICPSSATGISGVISTVDVPIKRSLALALKLIKRKTIKNRAIEIILS